MLAERAEAPREAGAGCLVLLKISPLNSSNEAMSVSAESDHPNKSGSSVCSASAPLLELSKPNVCSVSCCGVKLTCASGEVASSSMRLNSQSGVTAEPSATAAEPPPGDLASS